MDKKGVYFLCLHTHPQTHLQRMLNIILFITLHLAVGLWYMRMYIYVCTVIILEIINIDII